MSLGNSSTNAHNYEPEKVGMIKGEVMDIAHDFTVINDLPVFKVKCVLFQKQVRLKNGYAVFLSKGLSFHAEFVIAGRSLYQLIYDKADDWLNPIKA